MLRAVVWGLPSELVPIADAWWIVPILSVAHVFYFLLWVFPGAWIAFTISLTQHERPAWVADKELASQLEEHRGNEASALMSKAAHAIKILQFGALFLWVSAHAPRTFELARLVSLPPSQLTAGLLVTAVGQVFNAAIYTAIGLNGVYYGNRFKARLGPWVTGFPFNVPGPVGDHYG